MPNRADEGKGDEKLKAEIKERIEQIKNGEVPNGYKKTKVGIIPQEWEVEKLGKGIKLISGQHIDAVNYNELGIGVGYLTGPSDYSNNKIKLTKYTDKPKAICKKNDILITVKGSGTGKIIFSDNEYCISRQLMAIRVEKYYREYIFHILKTKEEEYNSDSVGLIPGITRDDVNNTMILNPKLQEQTQIASILATWDTAIEKQQKLIELKKEQKKWLMQELLTGKKRLKGFSGEWKEVRIKNKFKIKNEIVGDRKIKAVAVGVFGIRLREDIFSKELSNDYSKNKVISKNNICFGIGTNEIVYDILFEDKIYCVSPAYKVYEVVGVNPFIIKGILYVKKKEFSKKYMIISARQGKSVDFDGLLNEKIKLPSIEEQKAIAEILITADQEVNLLEKELEAMKEQKKGLMQLLLTGIVRV